MLKVKPFRQKPGTCGPASLKIVLGYYNVEKSEEELAKLTNYKQKTGTQAKNILSAAKKLGFTGLIKDNADFSDLGTYIKKKIPVIVDWFSEDDGHYSVAIGLDEKYIYLQDPQLGKIRKIERKIFRRIWFDYEKDYPTAKKDFIIRRMIIIFRKDLNEKN